MGGWVLGLEIVFCCYNCLDLCELGTGTSSWEQKNCVEKRLCKFEAEGREFVTEKVQKFFKVRNMWMVPNVEYN